MPAFAPSIFSTISRYAGKIRTMRDDIRAERVMNALHAATAQGHRLAGHAGQPPHRPPTLNGLLT